MSTTIQANLRNGFTQMPDDVLKMKGLSFRAKCIYCLILSYARQKDTCFPSHEQMAEDLDTSVDTIQRGLKELKDSGLINWITQKNQKPNIYRILPVQKCGIAITQKCSIATTQKCGTNHTNSKHIIESYEDSSKKPKKEEVTKPQPCLKPFTQEEIDAKKKSGLNASGMTPLSHIIPPEHWQELERQKRKETPRNTTHFNNCTKKSPIFIDSIIEQFTSLLGDDIANTAQNINRAAKLYRQLELSEDKFRALLYEAFDQARRYPTANIQKKRSDGRSNRIPVFFAILEDRATAR